MSACEIHLSILLYIPPISTSSYYKAANSVPSQQSSFYETRMDEWTHKFLVPGLCAGVINVIYPIMIEQKHTSRKNCRNISLCQKEQRTISFQYTYIRFLFTTTTIKKLNQQHHHHHGKYKYAC